MMKKLFLALVCALSLIPYTSDGCTSAIFTGKVTADGRPILWKNRDTGELNNRVDYNADGGSIKYSFFALVNSPEKGKEAWSGSNETGFAIMNTASYNLQEKDDKTPSKSMDREGEVMYKALATCRTLADFENMLDNMKKPFGVEANFGVIDGEGGAAYYEVNNFEWKKIDINNPSVAPQGYLVYTNHSYTGRIDEGMGYVRFNNASVVIAKYIGQGNKITPKWVMNELSRCYYHSLLDIDLKQNPTLAASGYFVDQDFIPRRSTSAVTIVKGINKGDDIRNLVNYFAIGYPMVAETVAVRFGEELPEGLRRISEEDGNCRLCNEALERKKEVFNVSRGNGKNYFNVVRALEIMAQMQQREENIW